MQRKSSRWLVSLVDSSVNTSNSQRREDFLHQAGKRSKSARQQLRELQPAAWREASPARSRYLDLRHICRLLQML